MLRCSVPDPAASARQATVLEQLADLAKQAQLLTSRTLLDWLRLLTQLQLGEREQQQQRQHLRAVVDLRAQLQVCRTDPVSVRQWTQQHQLVHCLLVLRNL